MKVVGNVRGSLIEDLQESLDHYAANRHERLNPAFVEGPGEVLQQSLQHTLRLILNGALYMQNPGATFLRVDLPNGRALEIRTEVPLGTPALHP